jgi:hypothetical protein
LGLLIVGENMSKKQKVRFHKGDRRPGGNVGKLCYEKRMTKKKNKIIWQAVEQPTKSVVIESFFEEDVDKVVNFQNKHLVWQVSGGMPKFLFIRR